MTYNPDIKGVINIKALQAIQDKFSEASGIPALIVDSEGIPLTDYSNGTDLCHYIHSSPLGKERCRECDKLLGMRAVSSPEKRAWHICHAGLVDVSVPVIVEDMYVGQVMCGQVLFPEIEAMSREQYEILGRQLNLEGETLWEHVQKIKVISRSKFFNMVDLLTIISNYIVESSINDMYQKQLHEQEIKLIEAMSNRIKMEKSLKEMELKTLQAQVNPHFLFNTLNTIACMAVFESAKTTEHMTYSLANLLRYSINNINQSVRIQDALVYIEDYLNIQSIRFGDRLTYKIDVDPQLMDVQMPAMTLQPLVENSIVHGIEPKIRGGEIRITGGLLDDCVWIEVYDSGVGMSKETIDKLLDGQVQTTGKGHSTAIGFNNVRKRLEHYFEGKVKISIESEQGGWSKFIMSFPYQSREERADDQTFDC